MRWVPVFYRGCRPEDYTPAFFLKNETTYNILQNKCVITMKNRRFKLLKQDEIIMNRRNIEIDFNNGVMPNLYGMNLMDAIFLLENAGLKVSFSGKGHIIDQSIKKGKKISKNKKIKLIASI